MTHFSFVGTVFARISHTSPTNAATFVSRDCGGYTLAFTNRIAHSGLHGETGVFRMGALSLPSDCFARFGNPVGPGVRTANFAAFWPWSRGISKNAESLRDSDALMRVAVPRRRGPAGLRDPIAVSLAALIDFAVLVVYDNSTRKHICRFHTLVCSMRLATRCRSFALSTASNCRW